VSIIVTVRADGTPQSVKVVSDPGTGFGRAARLCALARRYTPALDRTGTPMVSATPPIRVRFTR
jgi:protein TonB